MSLNTEKMSQQLRPKTVDLSRKAILITNLRGTEQAEDLSVPPNCGGFGRIRHFRRAGSPGWPLNPLPIDPAGHKLGLAQTDLIKAQVFQSASCNWRCWYCYVPFDLLSANPKHSSWLTMGELLDLYQQEGFQAPIIDLSGGQPELTPEWVPWMMRELQSRGLESSVYLWSDDNLSNDYFWRYLSKDDMQLIENYPNYGKVCCFKGFDAESFAFNTKAEPSLFIEQFKIFQRYMGLNIDLYGYATFTTPNGNGIESKISAFVDQLQNISVNLPLRVVPLQIYSIFAPTKPRMAPERERAVELQNAAIECWKSELERRFPAQERSKPIYEVQL